MSAHATKLEAKLKGSIQRLQLDNQMLDATHPVVLAPASIAHAHSAQAQSLTGDDGALITFEVSMLPAAILSALSLSLTVMTSFLKYP